MAIEIVDDRSEHCIPFILDKIKAHCDYYKKEGKDAPPFFLGLNGIQGAGKTTLVSARRSSESSKRYRDSRFPFVFQINAFVPDYPRWTLFHVG